MIRIRRITVLLWCALLVVWVAVMIQPLSVTLSRLAGAGGFVVLWLVAVLLVWRRRPVSLAIMLVVLVPGIWLAFPGRETDVEKLRESYLRNLQRYEGTRYVWGGENRLGIDCSGLVRRAWIHANLERGLVTLNPGPVRKALAMIWQDRTAMNLRDETDGLTIRSRDATSINSLDQQVVRPGTLAVTRNGVHVLASLGHGKWIQASPGEGRVITLPAPSENTWYESPVVLVEWAELAK